MKFFLLFGNFFTIGLLSVGGGFAIIPFLFNMADRSDGWLTREMIGDMLAVAQSLPGAIGANLSAYVGFQYAGVVGGFVAAFGLIAPALIIISVVARMLKAFQESVFVKNLLSGLRPAAAGLISAAALGAIAIAIWNSAAPVWFQYIRWKETLIFCIIFFLVFKFKKHPIIYIAAAAVLGVVLKL